MHVLITGANRGLGFEFVRQFVAGGDRVFAVARNVSAELAAAAAGNDAVTIVNADVCEEEDVAAAASAVAREVGFVDVVVNNAAINPRKIGLGSYTRKAMLETFATNAVAPMLVAQAFLELLQNSTRPRIINISSQVGSFSWNETGTSPLYAASKAALNMYTRSLAREAEGVIVVAAHPGWVKTDMGGSSAPLTPTESVSALRVLIDRLEPSDSGAFFNYNGQRHGW